MAPWHLIKDYETWEAIETALWPYFWYGNMQYIPYPEHKQCHDLWSDDDHIRYAWWLEARMEDSAAAGPFFAEGNYTGSTVDTTGVRRLHATGVVDRAAAIRQRKQDLLGL